MSPSLVASTFLARTFVTGTVVSVQVLPSPPHDPLDLPRTRVVVEDRAGGLHAVFLPGSNGAPPVVVGGVPPVAPGETWLLELVDAPVGRVPAGLHRGMVRLDGPPVPVWNLNGLSYDPDQLPLPFALQEGGSADLGFDDSEAVVRAALDAWSVVGCSSFAFDYQGTTEAGFADDGENVLSWEDETWEWGGEVAGLTATRFELDPEGEVRPAGADIVFNGVDWTWTTGPGNVYRADPLLNAASVVVHELGHVTGMDHELSLVASTMFFAYIGGDWQGTLSGDDRRGLCENYGDGSDECATDSDCAAIYGEEAGLVCRELDGLSICDEVRDEVGGACSLTDFNCAAYCVFTDSQGRDGYCSKACEGDEDCPEGFSCGTAGLFLYDDPGTEETLCVADEVVAPADTGAAGGDTGAPAADSGVPPEDPAGGCGCAAGGGPGGLLLLPGVALLLGRRRRP